LASLSPASVRDQNPIGLLQHMTTHDDVMLCPLVYGYVNYTQVQHGVSLAFHDAPKFDAGPPGSILGGTGIAVTKRCEIDASLIDHLLWLLSETAQSGFIPRHAGQPSHIDSWRDEAINAASGHFYLNTLATVQAASLRPRDDGFIARQAKASALLRDGLLAGVSAASLTDLLNDLCRARTS
jgi:multiple sugar transport system substrate-binding protein